MAPRSIKAALADVLDDLTGENFKKFCHHLMDLRGPGPRVRRKAVEGKSCLEVADVMVSTFTEAKVVGVAEEILRDIGCNLEADDLVNETGGPSPKPGGDIAEPHVGAAGKKTESQKAEGRDSGKHFVDRHRIELTNRVSNIGPILDELLDKDVIQQETYDQIRALPTSQDKIRELYCGPLKASEVCKDAFYKSLQDKEKYLIDDLKDK
ncbi:apoptosis-associated speck-like protein containing a CARD isoform X1 [Mastacembelus armatus]|uniref:PYD and CARD domain containing n=1 Tax=Mastacembelus armatus TaxID=205130 RepID=A0A3Q3LIV6_9TELE|nr:apoptosis-associated speck-like protein containing a CARD isoform X1 [Mastacembelus armatus]